MSYVENLLSNYTSGFRNLHDLLRILKNCKSVIDKNDTSRT